METKVQEYIEYVLSYFNNKNYVKQCRLEMIHGNLNFSLHINELFYQYKLIKESHLTAEQFCIDIEKSIQKDIFENENNVKK